MINNKFTWINTGSKILIQVILLYSISKSDSVEENVVLFLLLAVGSMSQLFDFGFTSTFSRIVSYADSGISIGKNGEFREAVRIQVLGDVFILMNRIYTITSLSAFVFVIIITYRSFQTAFSGVSLNNLHYTAYFVTFIATFVVLYSNSAIATLTGLNKIERYKKNELIFSSFSIICHIYIILFVNAPILNVITHGITMIANAVMNIYTSESVKLKDELVIKTRYNSKSNEALTHYVLESATKSGVGVLMSLGLIQYSVFYVAQSENPSISSAYSFAIRIYQTVMMFSNISFYNRLPDLAKLYIGSANSAFYHAMKLIRTSALIYAFGISATYLLVFYIFREYELNQSMLPVVTSTIFSIGMLVERVNGMLTQLYTLSNDIVWHKINFMYGLSAVLITLVLTNWIDLVNAIAISHLIATIFVVLPMILSYCKRVFEIDYSTLIVQAIAPGILVVIANTLLITK